MRYLGAICLLAGCFTKPDRPTDGIGVDTMPGGDGTPGASALARFKNAVNGNTSSLTYNIEVLPDSVLFVSVQTGSSCGSVGPNVQSVTALTMPMMRIDQIANLPGCTNNAVTEIWMLADPPAGALVPITVALDGIAGSLHSAALDFTGVDRSDPVRAKAKMSGTGTGSTVTVDPEPGDLIFDVVSQGNFITMPGGSQTQIFRENHSAGTTSDNTAASTAPGAAVSTLVWEFAQSDFWQTIAVALRPAT